MTKISYFFQLGGFTDIPWFGYIPRPIFTRHVPLLCMPVTRMLAIGFRTPQNNPE